MESKFARAALFSAVFLGTLGTLVTLVTLGCEKKSPPTPAPAASASAASVADFPNLEPASWVNGAPRSLAELRGKTVVLVEAWHPT